MKHFSPSESAWDQVKAHIRLRIGRLPGLSNDSRILVACSGGADSVVLLRTLTALLDPGLIALGHVDHGMRPSSKKDMEFCRALAGELEVPFFHESLNMGPPPEGKAMEKEARELRYEALYKMAKAWQAQAIATAHHLSDQVETILFRILRGTGLPGLEGIPEARLMGGDKGIWIVRPLLGVEGSLLKNAAKEQDFPFALDPTNLKGDATRNKIRLELIPFIEDRFGKGPVKALSFLQGQAHRFRRALRLAGRELLQSAKRASFGPIREIHFPLPENLLDMEVLLEALSQGAEILHPERWIGVAPVFLERCRELAKQAKAGKAAIDSGIVQAIRQKNSLVLMGHPLPRTFEKTPLTEPGKTRLLKGLFVKTRLISPPPSMEAIRAAAPLKAFLDIEKLGNPLFVRPRTKGDLFQPLGRCFKTKLKDFLASKGVPSWRRDLIPIVTTKKGEIAWIAGLEGSELFKVTATTKTALELELAYNDEAW